MERPKCDYCSADAFWRREVKDTGRRFKIYLYLCNYHKCEEQATAKIVFGKAVDEYEEIVV